MRVRTVLLVFLVVAVAATIINCSGKRAGQGATMYHCPMHPTITSDKPGDCPVCGMRLVPIEKGGTAPAGAKSAEQKTIYHCPMHPTVTSDKPGDCPICGMRLVPMEPSEKPATAAATELPKKKTMYRSTMNPNEISDKPGKDSMGMDMVPFEVETAAEGTPKGLTAVTVTPAARERMGITFGTVVMKNISRDVRTSARVVADETRLYRVTTKIGGWVDRLFVSVTGQSVRKGDPLLTIYSPELVATQEEYLSALRAAKQLGESPYDFVSKGGSSLLEAARRRLSLWDISDAQIRRLEETGQVEKTLTLSAPSNGVVTEKSVLAGQKIMPGDSLLVVADLSSVWGEADVYESDLPYVKVGMPVEITFPYWPGKKFSGKVSFLYPYLDPESRTLKARLQIPNSEMLLKPEMYGDARLSYQLGDKLVVPEGAVTMTGAKAYAFRDAGESKLQPVEVELGPRSDGYYEVVSGLSEGDRVVTSANFLVDSESSMRAALEALAGKK